VRKTGSGSNKIEKKKATGFLQVLGTLICTIAGGRKVETGRDVSEEVAVGTGGPERNYRGNCVFKRNDLLLSQPGFLGKAATGRGKRNSESLSLREKKEYCVTLYPRRLRI